MTQIAPGRRRAGTNAIAAGREKGLARSDLAPGSVQIETCCLNLVTMLLQVEACSRPD
jgi:hypothetical protein